MVDLTYELLFLLFDPIRHLSLPENWIPLKCSHFCRKCPRKHVMFGTLGVCNVFGQSLYHHMFAIYPLWNGRLYTPILAKLITSPSFVIQNEYVLIGYINQSPILFHCILHKLVGCNKLQMYSIINLSQWGISLISWHPSDWFYWLVKNYPHKLP